MSGGVDSAVAALVEHERGAQVVAVTLKLWADQHNDGAHPGTARALDPVERRSLVRALEKRLIDEEVHVFYTLQWHRIIPHSAKVKGWTVTPSHYLNNQLDTVWLSE